MQVQSIFGCISVVITLIQKPLDGLIKIALQQAHFTLTIDFKLTFCLLNGLSVRDGSVSREDVLAKAQNLVVQSLNPVSHCHWVLL